MTVAVQVSSDGSQTKLKVHLTKWQWLCSRPRIDAVIVAKVACHSNTTSACFNEIFPVANGFVGRQQRTPNLPFLIT